MHFYCFGLHLVWSWAWPAWSLFTNCCLFTLKLFDYLLSCICSAIYFVSLSHTTHNAHSCIQSQGFFCMLLVVLPRPLSLQWLCVRQAFCSVAAVTVVLGAWYPAVYPWSVYMGAAGHCVCCITIAGNDCLFGYFSLSEWTAHINHSRLCCWLKLHCNIVSVVHKKSPKQCRTQ